MELNTSLQSGFLLRPMTAEDVPAVALIEKELQPTPWSEGVFHDCLRGGYSCSVVVSDAGVFDKSAVAGFVVVSNVLDESHLLNIVVAEQYQRKGLAWAVLHYLFEQLPRQNVRRLYLEVRASNQGAQVLYQKLGFEVVGRRKNYYRLSAEVNSGREDAVIMRKDDF